MMTGTGVRQWFFRAVAAVLLLVLGYAVAGAIGGAIPTNRAWRPAARGVRIFVESNGVHTGIVMPKSAAGVDWRRFAPAGDLADPRYGRFDHVAIGWGDKAFFLETKTWADVKPRTVLGAAIGSADTLMHVEHVPAPTVGDDVRAVVLSEAAYRRLAAYIAASFGPGGARYPGYAGYDVFYDARGRYDAVHTCNAWSGDALRYAGVRVGAWTPFPGAVMAWF
ncbi:TIGR02117 family protein [Sphingomonas sp. PB2P19]|uniref:TIGR02117 family protein n=1 Tax=Sphingomonas rhamnosi TaxID=3096156 RepID=UPI002FC7D4A1